MAPVTRSGGNAQPSSSKRTLDDLTDNESIDNPQPQAEKHEPRRSPEETTLERLLTRALGGVKELERENNTLRKKVKALESRLDRVIEADDAPLQPRRSKRAAPATAGELRSQVVQLTKQVRRLEKSNEKYRKRVHQLSMKELKTEAEDLVDVADFEVGDSAHKMRKILRRFHDLMLENSLAENEECAICTEPLEPKKSRSLPCQHTYCDGCVRKLESKSDGEAELITCPHCRAVCSRDEAELIEHTASEQWDALLDVARQWARMDVRREEDTTEEEDAEDFIDDDPEESSTTASEPAPEKSRYSTPEPLDAPPETPSRLRRRHVVASPTPEAAPPDDNVPSTTDNDLPAPVAANHVEEEQPGTPPPPHTPAAPTQRTPSYSQSPAKDKRKMLEELAEARNKKRRL